MLSHVREIFGSVQWAQTSGCPGDEWTCYAAAQNRNWDVVKWLHNQGCPWYERALCDAAAQHDNMEILQWLHSQGCVLGADICFWVARSGNWDMVKWLHDQDCPWNENICMSIVWTLGTQRVPKNHSILIHHQPRRHRQAPRTRNRTQLDCKNRHLPRRIAQRRNQRHPRYQSVTNQTRKQNCLHHLPQHQTRHSQQSLHNLCRTR